MLLDLDQYLSLALESGGMTWTWQELLLVVFKVVVELLLRKKEFAVINAFVRE